MKEFLDKYLAATVVLWLVSLFVYANYYDILIPGITNGSYREAVGQLFIVPSLILSVFQVLLGAFIIFASVTTMEGKQHETKSLFTASFMVFLFSLTYVIFPMFGPFYYIVFATSIAPPNVLFVELAWTAAFLTVSTLLIHRLQKVKWHFAFFIAGLVGIFIVVAAS
jgi:hypothetical protein